MLIRREMLGRIIAAKENRVPIVNYGVIIAYMRGILNRSTEMFNL
jgi:hypothetical protein